MAYSFYSLLEKMEKPLGPESNTRDPNGESFYPSNQERQRILTEIRRQGMDLNPRGKPCSLFKWEVMEEALKTAIYITKISDLNEFLKCCAVLRDGINEEIYVYAFIYALLNRTDTRGIRVPPIEEIMPYWYFPSEVITQASRKVKNAKSKSERIVIPYTFSGNQLDPEFRVAYFREDLLVNSHHWHWHLVYPFTWLPEMGGTKDRKGELFYYMHQQMLARYDAERLSNNLARVKPLSDIRSPIQEGYSSRLMSTLTGTFYPTRAANSKLSDVIEISLARIQLWKDRLLEAIHTGEALGSDGKKVKLIDPEGIDILGAMVESAAISVNQKYYGILHNFGHVILSRIHDPDGRFGGDMGVMGFTQAAMRDPVFYRWHKEIDNMFDEYKLNQKSYTTQDLTWPDVVVSNVSVKAEKAQKANFLQTFWQEREVFLSRGINFVSENPVVVSIRHLQHEDFSWNVEVDNTTGKEQEAMVRILIAPKYDEFQARYQFSDLRRIFIEMDKFYAKLKPGKQTITRRSSSSNVTISTPQSFEVLANLPPDAPPKAEDAICGCGWPDHMLLPKGRPEGMSFILFAMVSDFNKDKVQSSRTTLCDDAASYCGILNQKYPDRRNMGFPFDRAAGTSVISLRDFLTPNMRTSTITIRHTGDVLGKDGVVTPATIF